MAELVELVELIGQLVFSIHSQMPYRIAWKQKVAEESEEVWRSEGVKGMIERKDNGEREIDR